MCLLLAIAPPVPSSECAWAPCRQKQRAVHSVHGRSRRLSATGPGASVRRAQPRHWQDEGGLNRLRRGGCHRVGDQHVADRHEGCTHQHVAQMPLDYAVRAVRPGHRLPAATGCSRFAAAGRTSGRRQRRLHYGAAEHARQGNAVPRARTRQLHVSIFQSRHVHKGAALDAASHQPACGVAFSTMPPRLPVAASGVW